MNVVGIETSCDETAAAVVQDGKKILSSVVATSLKEHRDFGGIIPEIASRRQMEFIQTVVKRSLQKAHLKLKDVDLIATTVSPGLIGSLLVGAAFGRGLAFATKKPFIEVDHIMAHLYANFLGENPPPFPAVGLIVSGGHSALYLVESPTVYRLVGQTRDDAAGECFDKVARLLGLGYPGGPAIEKAAQKGEKGRISFPCAKLKGSYDFSFSGIKTSVLYYLKEHWNKRKVTIADIAYAFQESIVETLVQKTIDLCRQMRIATLLMGGGVSANSFLRKRIREEAQKCNISVFQPPLWLCTDNAAMIGGLGYHLFLQKHHRAYLKKGGRDAYAKRVRYHW